MSLLLKEDLKEVIYCLLSLTFPHQAHDIRTNEVVAIKKMSYSGKQSNEVGPGNSLILRLYCRCEISRVCSSIDRGSAYITEMAGHRQRSEVPPEAAPPQHC